MSKMGLGDAELFSADVKMTQVERFSGFFSQATSETLFTQGSLDHARCHQKGSECWNFVWQLYGVTGGELVKIEFTTRVVLFHFIGFFLHHWHCNAVAGTYKNAV